MVNDKANFENNNQVTSMYALYIISIIMNLLPIFSIATLGMFIFLVTFIANYILKFKADNQSADHGHYTYMAKTIWIFSFLVLIGLVLSYFIGDHTIVNNMIQSAQNGIMYTSEQMMGMTADYIKDNALLFGGYFLPVIFYLIYRMGRGLYESMTGQVIDNPKGWL